MLKRKGVFGVTGYAIAVVLAAICPAALLSASPQSSASPSFDAAQQRAVLDKYCVTCHNEKLKTAGLALDKTDLDHVDQSAQTWEKVIRKLRTGQMPPVGLPRPDAATYNALATSLETTLDLAYTARPEPGRAKLHRLNRTEYGNAIRDLLGLEVNVADLLPPDDASYGFDNIADVLTVSPSLLERYLAAASKISRLAVGDPATSPIVDTYRVRADVTQNEHIEGLPLGTRGGVLIKHNFPLDGEYVIKVKLLKSTVDLLFGGTAPDELLEIAVNGERVQTLIINPPKPPAPEPSASADGAKSGGAAPKGFDASGATELSMSQPKDNVEVRIPVKAGPQTVTVAFLQKTDALAEDLMQPFERSTFDPSDPRGLPHVLSVSIAGPFNAKGASDTPARDRIFVCHPAGANQELPCAKKILSTLARRAYRRPVNDNDLETLLSFYQSARNAQAGDSKTKFEAGVEMGVRRILASPQFVYRFERDPAGTAPDSTYRIGDLELASRLSFFLWSSIPDDTLLNLASQGKLKDPAVLEQQVRRMMADPKAESLVTNFADQWLYLRNLRGVAPDLESYPNFDDNLRQAFKQETELFFASIMHEDRSVLDLLNADYTFVNERLAHHYGIPNVIGSQFRRVAVTEDARRGLLGQGSILTVTSVATRTSPVQRGKWMLENVLGTPPNPPPANVPPLKENTAGNKPKSIRELMEAHRANPTCAACHKVLDPYGFALENYDGIGAWRSLTEAGTPVNAVVQLADGSQVDGPGSLRKDLLSRPNVFVGTMTEKMLTYALGRGLDYRDMPVVRRIVRDTARNDYRFSSLVMNIVKSAPFEMRRSEAHE